MLSVAIGGKGAAAKVVRKEKTLWDTKQLAPEQWLSQTAYLTVKDITGSRITVENSFGQTMHVSKDIIEKMHSANHFKTSVPMNMTSLAELLESVGDTVFSVRFHKKSNEEQVQKRLQETKLSDLKDKAALSTLAKELIEGEICEMVCCLVKAESRLGRSTVIDLSSTKESRFRQIDHRTIEYIIFNNAKYELKKASKKVELDADEKKKDEPKWDFSKLAVGNTFSGTSYYKTTNVNGDQVITRCQEVDIAVSKDILEYEMHSAGVFATEEKITLTQMAELLEEARTTCFTVCFTAKVDEAVVRDRLASCT